MDFHLCCELCKQYLHDIPVNNECSRGRGGSDLSRCGLCGHICMGPGLDQGLSCPRSSHRRSRCVTTVVLGRDSSGFVQTMAEGRQGPLPAFPWLRWNQGQCRPWCTLQACTVSDSWHHGAHSGVSRSGRGILGGSSPSRRQRSGKKILLSLSGSWPETICFPLQGN